MYDFRKVELRVGDSIAYAGRKGSELWLTQGVIKELGVDTIRVLPTYAIKPVTLKNLSTVAVLGR